MEVLTKNFSYKIASLIIASILWYSVHVDEVIQINQKVNARVHVSQGYVVVGHTEYSRSATIVGPRSLVKEFMDNPIIANIRIPSGQTGLTRLKIGDEYFLTWNPRLKITVHDAHISVFVDQKISKVFPIKEYITGIPAEGFIIEKAKPNPTVMTLSGPKSKLLKMKHILTEPIDISGIQSTKSYSTKISKEAQQYLEGVENDVLVSIQVGEKKINKRYGSIPIEVDGAHLPFTLRPSYVSVVIQGTPAVLNFIKRTDFRAFVDARDLKEGNYDRKVLIKIPPDTSLIEVFPEIITLEITQNKSKQSKN